MPQRISVPEPDEFEDLRQLAEAMADLHYVVGVIVESKGELVPGEAVYELEQAWQDSSEPSMRKLIADLTPVKSDGGSVSSPIAHGVLVEHELVKAPGRLKKSMLGRLKDRFFKFWNSQPRTDEKRTGAADAACDYLDLGATVVSSIPGYEKAVEILSLTKQLVGVRSRRGV
jgi:hypothetical protein